ncbi:hypothetical protein ACOMHN_052641 [Nucella lapillus]
MSSPPADEFSHPVKDSEEAGSPSASDRSPVYARIRPRGPRRVSASIHSPVQTSSPQPLCCKSSSDGNMAVKVGLEENHPDVIVTASGVQHRMTADFAYEEHKKPKDKKEDSSHCVEQRHEDFSDDQSKKCVNVDKKHAEKSSDDNAIQRQHSSQNDACDTDPEQKRTEEKTAVLKVTRQNALQNDPKDPPELDVLCAPSREISRQNSSQSQTSNISGLVRSDVSRQDSIQSSILAMAGSPPLTSQEHLLIDEVAASLAELDSMAEGTRSFFEDDSARRQSGSQSDPGTASEYEDTEMMFHGMSTSAIYSEIDVNTCAGSGSVSTDPKHAPPQEEAKSDTATLPVEKTDADDMFASANYADVSPGRVCSILDTMLIIGTAKDLSPGTEADKFHSARIESPAPVLTVSVEYAPSDTKTPEQEPATSSGELSQEVEKTMAEGGEENPVSPQSSDTTAETPPLMSQTAITTQPVSLSSSQPTTETSKSEKMADPPTPPSKVTPPTPNPSPILCQPKHGRTTSGSSRTVSWSLEEADNRDKPPSSAQQPEACSAEGGTTPILPNGCAVAPTEGQKRLGQVLQELKKTEEGKGEERGYTLKDMATTGLSVISSGVKDVARVFVIPFNCCKRKAVSPPTAEDTPVYARSRPRGPRRVSTSMISPFYTFQPSCRKSSSDGNVSLIEQFEDENWYYIGVTASKNSSSSGLVHSDVSRQDSIESSILAMAGSPPLTSQELIDEVAASLAELERMAEARYSFYEDDIGEQETGAPSDPGMTPELWDPALFFRDISSSAIYSEIEFDRRDTDNKDKPTSTKQQPDACSAEDESSPSLPGRSAVPPTEGQKRLGQVMRDLKKAEEGEEEGGYCLRDIAATGLSVISDGVKDVARVFATPLHCCTKKVCRM